MPFAVSSLLDALGIPATKIPIDATAFASYVIPPAACYIIFAVLALTPQTRPLRVALWPIVALLAWRATVSVEMSPGKPETKYLNVDLMLCMFVTATHTLSWTLAKKPLVRHLRPAKSSPSIIMDALDLTVNFRGIGWNWSRGAYVPRETRPTNRVAFTFHVLLSTLAHILLCGILHRAILTFTATAGSSPNASTIFDESLPFFLRYLRSSIISIIGAFSIYAILQMEYDALTFLGVFLFRQDPAQWPPAFNSPAHSTSLNEFWTRRWHQFYRDTFLLGAYPFTVIFGRVGKVLGAFMSSALFHHLTLAALDDRSECWRMLVGFGMMAPGVLAEHAFYKVTGRKVGGPVGWVWTMAWLILWGHMIVEGFVRVGMFVPLDFIGPVQALVENWVTTFDAWLHTF